MELALYCALVVGVCAAALRWLRTDWVYLFIVPFLPPMLAIGANAAWRGDFDAFDPLVFVMLWLIAFTIAVAMIAHKRLGDRRE